MTATDASPSPSPGVLLRTPPDGAPVELGGDLWGFAGVHGGLVLALMTSAMQQQAPDAALRSVTARFHRAIQGEFQIATTPLRAGRSTASFTAQATSPRGVHVDAAAVFGPSGEPTWPAVAPPSPAVPPPEDCPLFQVPPEFVPITTQLEIRPVDDNRPYAGCAEPHLAGWIRLVEDDEPPDPHRFVFLMDALAPSYAAVLETLQLVPTIEITVHPGDDFDKVTSPWVLMQARTRAASAGGWIDEQIDAWSLDGTYLGSAQQLRMALRPAESEG